MANGYMGKILWVDLSTKKLKDEVLDEKLCRKYIGGYGLGARILFSHQKPGVEYSYFHSTEWNENNKRPTVGQRIPAAPELMTSGCCFCL